MEVTLLIYVVVVNLLCQINASSLVALDPTDGGG